MANSKMALTELLSNVELVWFLNYHVAPEMSQASSQHC